LVDIAAIIVGQKAAASESKLDDLLVPLVRKTLKVFVAAFGLVFIAGNLDIDVSSLLAGLGLGGLAFALAAQDTVKNLFGSLTILVDRPFAVGDWVLIDNVEGTVEEVGIRSTRVRTFYNSQITVPNANLISANVDNFGARQYRRWKATLGLTYDTAPDKIEAFCEGMRELVRHHPYTRKDYFEIHFNNFGGASLDILLYVFFETPDWSTELRERHRLGLDILRLAEQLGVEFAFPTQTLHIKQGSAPLQPPEMEGYEQKAESSRAHGRETARELLDSSLGGRIPPPVGSEQRGESA
jgi:MscS family membrane protein